MPRVVFAAMLFMLAGSHCFAQGLTRVMSGYAATSGPHAVLWIARDAGLFEKNGLRTEVAYIRSGSTMAQTLVSGEIQMSQMGGPAMVAAGVAGMDVTFVAVALNTTPIVIMGNGIEDGRSQRQSDRRDALRFQHGYFGAIRDPQGRTAAGERRRADPA